MLFMKHKYISKIVHYKEKEMESFRRSFYGKISSLPLKRWNQIRDKINET